MKKHPKSLILLYNIYFSLVLMIGCTSVWAAESLFYNANLSMVSKNSLDLFLKNHNLKTHADYNIAQNDLNGDGMMEYILRPNNCDMNSQACTHLILAENKDKIILLSEIKGRKLTLAGTFSHGIQDFLAFQNDNNDYEYERYIWSPSQAKYILDGAH